MKTPSALRWLNVVLLLALGSFVVTCKHEDPPPPPVALFDYYPNTNLVAPVTLSFTNKSTNAESYLWSYGGSQTDTDKDIVLTANSGGTYTVSLQAKGQGGTDTYSRTITVADPPVIQTTAGFTYSPTQNLVAPAKITFANTSKNATSYKWDFNDGTTSTETNPVKEFTKTGTFKVKLTATGKTNVDEYSTDITVNGPATVPTADFVYSPSSNLTAPVKITFTNASKNASTYRWDFGDGTSATDASPTKEYTKAGDYTVKLTATDSKNQTAQKTVVVSVKAAAVTPVADWTWSASNLKVTFSNASKNATSYSWNFNDGTAASTTTNPVHDYAKAGVYTVTLTASDGKTQDQDSKLVTVSAPATASCDFDGWATYLKQTKYIFDAKNGCTAGWTEVWIQNTSNTDFAIRLCIQSPTGSWSCGLDKIASGKEYKGWVCGKALGYKVWGEPSSKSTLFGDGSCKFPTFP